MSVSLSLITAIARSGPFFGDKHPRPQGWSTELTNSFLPYVTFCGLGREHQRAYAV